MKKKFLVLGIAVASLSLFSCGGGETKVEETVVTEETDEVAEELTLAVNTESSEVKWVGKKAIVQSEHYGTIGLTSGEITVKGTKVTGGTVVIDMNSIVCLDLEDEEKNGQLVGHLKSDDFFGVETYPTATFTITGSKAGKVKGNLTIKEKTEEIEFPVSVSNEDGVVTATGEVIIDRSKFDVRYGSGSFFDDLGDKAISDDIALTITLVAGN